jgi:translation initiation factor IF-3
MPSKHISHASSPMKALYSIFVQPALTASRSQRPQLLSRHATATPQLTRAFTTTQSLHLSKKKPARVAEVREQKWNEEITARVLQLVNPETNQLDEPITRYDVLKTLDLKTHRLVQLTEGNPYPVCKIISKKEEYAAEKRRKEQQKESKQAAAKERSVKTLELNWAIDGNDLAHRLEKVKTFLEEGRKVEIILAAKKRGRKASKEECEEVLGKIREVAEGVRGAKEPKPFEEGRGCCACCKCCAGRGEGVS